MSGYLFKYTKSMPTLSALKAKIAVGVASPEDMAAARQLITDSGYLGTYEDYLAADWSKVPSYAPALAAAQAEAQRRATQSQVKDVLNLRAAEERASRVVTLDDRKVAISIGGTSDSTEQQRRRQFAGTNVGPRV